MENINYERLSDTLENFQIPAWKKPHRTEVYVIVYW